MNCLKAIVASAAITISLMTFSAQAAEQQPKEAALRELFQLINLDALADQMFAQMLPAVFQQLRTMIPDLPERGFQILEEEFRDGFKQKTPELMSSAVQIYAERFSLAEIEVLAKFYRTPTGQKYIKELPAITQETIIFGQSWGAQIGEAAGQRAFERMVSEGLIE